MNKTKIEWADYTWNPIKGLCPEDCKLPDGKSYCYARRMYRRFGWDRKPRFDEHENQAPLRLRSDYKGKRVFVCSTFELFHPLADKWRDKIFETIRRQDDMTFIILTKRPERIDRRIPSNVWLGVSVTGTKDWGRVRALSQIMAKIENNYVHPRKHILFVSMEPFIGMAPYLFAPGVFDWLIIGRLTGHGHKFDPDPNDIPAIVSQARDIGIPVFLKNNLGGIWPGPLIQEYPK